MEYVVLMHVAVHDKAYYPTDMYPHADIACYNPTEVVFNAADKYGLKIFLGNDFFFKWDDPNIVTDPDARRRRLRAIGELYAQFGHHKSFYGWYWPNEAYIGGHYNERFMEYVNECSKEARRFTPHGKILIAPYGTRDAIPDDKYVKQLESMDVDIVAYQDEIGVQKSTVDETAKFYEGLRKAHDKVPHVKLWADVEIFDFEGQVYRSALIPADFDRIIKQFANVTPYVDNILVYQYQGMMSNLDRRPTPDTRTPVSSTPVLQLAERKPSRDAESSKLMTKRPCKSRAFWSQGQNFISEGLKLSLRKQYEKGGTLSLNRRRESCEDL